MAGSAPSVLDDADLAPRREGAAPCVADHRMVVARAHGLTVGDPRLPGYVEPGGDGQAEWLDSWARLEVGERDPLSHPAILGAWLRHLALPSRRDFRLFVTRDAEDGRLLAALPAEVVPCRPLAGCVLRHAPEFYLEDASLAVAEGDRDAVLEALLRQRVEGAGRVRGLGLGRVDGTSALLTRPEVMVVQEGHRSIIDVREGWGKVEERLSKNFRRNLVKAERKLERLGDVRFDTVLEPSRMAEGLARLVDIEERSWKAEAGTALGADEPFRNFWQDVLAVCSQRREAVVQFLVAEGRDVAGQLCLHIGDTLHVLKVAYDADHGRLAPGNLLLRRAMRGYCFERGVSWVSLVTGLDWHSKWQPEELRTFRLLLPSSGVAGSTGSLLAQTWRDVARFALARHGWLSTARDLRHRLRSRLSAPRD